MDYFAAMGAFVRSVELGSFSKVAAESGMKISTVSRYIAALESDLGAALFNRTTRRLKLTEAGRTFYEKAVQVLIDLDDARQMTSALNSKPQGVLRINIPSVFGRRHVMPHMKDFLAQYPDITLDATLTDLTVDLVETATDVAVRIGALNDSTLIAKRLAAQKRMLVAGPDYFNNGKMPTDPTDLTRYECLPFTLRQPAHWYYRPVAAPGAEMSEISISGHLRTNDSETLRDAVLSNQGIALLPTWLVGEDIGAGRLVTLLEAWEWNIVPEFNSIIWGIYPPKKVVSPKVRVFIDFIAGRFGSPPYWERT
ncbi:LysR family transcriptional regulator [Mesorhizobium sp. B2-4-15]|uniref:LysR family transcriptional regulator n=1 Tax=Mesorhizobium sp. B2-4-15 TaxID=2589934 RepID=UPI00114E031B|nr:LysR family transcriptional regulator [Mesorhizobium sp. B2-4-15]TPK67519.1 LysR family transcriptional regulator [Mesorhizobium sp. B2-4-15]